ncbi:MAG TPA: IPT/TIG domain-containing protein [Candidatus Sulfotelmatobacter sp.]|nr:IPT/TIG domain-containing protein [Candidatus Sulfotelmatobacter sp.]
MVSNFVPRSSTVTRAGAVLCLVVLGCVVYGIGHAASGHPVGSPTTWGWAPVLFATGLTAAATGQWNPFSIAAGADGRLSLSKWQTVIWTFVALWAYVVLFVHNVGLACTPSDVQSCQLGFPQSLLVLLGFSATTLIGAAGITGSQIAKGTIVKQQAQQLDLNWKWLVLGDDGNIDLTRFQVLLWTLVSVGVFVGDAVAALAGATFTPNLPDIGNALVLLMGFGQATYLGGKLIVTPGRPTILNFSAPSVQVGQSVTVTGTGFGAADPGSTLRLNGAVVPTTSWADTTIVFTVPPAQPWNQQPWQLPATPGVTVLVGALTSEAKTLTVGS